MIILFDLDNTLIDTERIKKDIFFAVGMEQGLTLEQAKELYHSVRNVEGVVEFSPQKFAHALAKKVGSTAEVLQKTIYERLQTMGPSMCIPGAVELIELALEKTTEVYVMSLGVHFWQMEKLEMCGLSKFFSQEKRILPEMHLKADDAKVVALKNFFGAEFENQESILINDKPDETKILLSVYNNMRALVRRDLNDSRFSEKDFVQGNAEYAQRFLYSESLLELKKFL